MTAQEATVGKKRRDRGDYGRLYYAANKAAINSKTRRYYEGHSEHIKKHNREYRALVAKTRPEVALARSRRRWFAKYGITEARYLALLSEQDQRCKICRGDVPGGPWNRFVVDHDHQTGAIRGLLCAHCNLGLGLFGDDPRRLEQAAEYLRASVDLRATA